MFRRRIAQADRLERFVVIRSIDLHFGVQILHVAKTFTQVLKLLPDCSSYDHVGPDYEDRLGRDAGHRPDIHPF